MSGKYIVEVVDLRKVFARGYFRKSHVVALDGFNVRIERDRPKIIAVAGESGSGKTTFANLLLDFLRPTSGTIRYDGIDLREFTREQRTEYRRSVQAVFQDPYDSFNPFYRIGHVFDLVRHRLYRSETGEQFRRRITDALSLVGLRAEDIFGKHPHQLSGGERQRVMIARAYTTKPKIVVADEPVSAVDATIRGMILSIMLEMKGRGISFFYITHDLSTAYQVADEIYLLYRGRVVERGPVEEIIANPRHPYSQLLVGSVPVPDPREKWREAITLPDDEGVELPEACCQFHPRCPRVMSACRVRKPPSVTMGGVEVSCFLYPSVGSQRPVVNG